MKYVKLFLLVAVALFAVNAVAFAEPADAEYRERINLEYHASKYFTINKKISRVFVGSKGIIYVHQPTDSPNEFVITARATKGSTTLFVWTEDGARYEYLVNVVDEEIGQAEIIEDAIAKELGHDGVHVKKIGDKILLTGTVKNVHEKDYAVQMVRLYTNNSSGGSNNNGNEVRFAGASINTIETSVEKVDLGNIINQLKLDESVSIPQVRLEAQIIAIRPQDTKYLGFQYNGTTNPGDDATIGNAGTFYGGESFKGDTGIRHNPWKWFIGNRGLINYSLSALTTNSKAKLLSRPSIMTRSGETASIKIGGEIPYRVLDNNGNASTQFKDYGIILKFQPTVDENGRIYATIETEVSNMSGETVDGNPILDTRSATTKVILEDGSTMIIGGLMDSSERKSVSKIPLLGDIPILGEFFKYTSKTKDKQELVILVTPYIVQDTSRAGMTDDMRDWYHNGQREKNSMNNVDLNALPPPFESEKDKKKKSKKDKKAKTQKSKAPEIVIEDEETRNQRINDEQNKNYDENQNVEVFGEDQ